MCSKFSFEKLPNPLKANSQKVALKLLAISRKIRNLSKVLSEEEIINLTGITVENMNNILFKSEQVEKKLLEGTLTSVWRFFTCHIWYLTWMQSPSFSVNLRLVHSIALQYQGMGLELDDLVYEGMLFWNCMQTSLLFKSDCSLWLKLNCSYCRGKRAEKSAV